MRIRTLLALSVALTFASGAVAQDALRAPALYPNPLAADHPLTVEVADADGAEAEVLDVLGRRVDGVLAAGSYLVRVAYADGRATAPARFTLLAPSRVQIQLVDGGQASGAAVTAPAPAPSQLGGLCPSGDVVFGGFPFSVVEGIVRARTDVTPEALRIRPVAANGFDNYAEYSTCLGDVQGVAFRYVDSNAQAGRQLRILSPSIVGNTSVTYTASGTDGTGPFMASYGFAETSINDGTMAGVPAAAFQLDSPFFPGGLGVYELIVLNGDDVVYRAVQDGANGLYVTSKSSGGRVNLLRSVVLSSIVDGFDVEGGEKPGDVSFVFEMESGDGQDVGIHAGEGAAVAFGTAVHITPKFIFPDPYALTLSDVRTVVTGASAFGLRALRFAAGGSEDDFLASEAQFIRKTGSYLDPQLNTVSDAQLPLAFVGPSAFGTQDVYGLQVGREPTSLEETNSNELGLLHGVFVPPAAARGGFNGLALDDAGEYYLLTARVRNVTDGANETITARVENVGGTGLVLTVDGANGTFSDYEFVFDRDVDGTAEVRNTYAAGTPVTFSPDAVAITASGASDRDDEYSDLGSSQDFLVGFIVDFGNGQGGVAYIFPGFASSDAEVSVRTVQVEANQPFPVQGLRERDTDDGPAARGLFELPRKHGVFR